MNKFESLPAAQQNIVLKLAAQVHYRDGVAHPDGSMGTVRCTHKQLKELLAEAILSQAYYCECTGPPARLVDKESVCAYCLKPKKE